MKKEIRTIILLNVINYINNFGIITYFAMYQNININHNIYALTLGIVLLFWLLSPVLLLFITTYPLLNNENLHYRKLRREVILNIFLKAIGYIVLLSYDKTVFFSDIYKFKVAIQFLLMLFTLIIDFITYKKAIILKSNSTILYEEVITELEKINIFNIKQANHIGSRSFYSFIIFGLSLTLFSSEEMNWHIDIIATVISSISFIKFIHSIYEKCILVYSNENKRKKIFKKEIIYTTISYSICIVVSMNLIKIEGIYFRYIIYLISIVTLYPIIQHNKKISVKYRKVKERLLEVE